MAKPALSITGGNPAGVPDYRPINLLSHDEIVESLLPPRETLYQVWVDWRGRGQVAVGPRCSIQTASAFAEAIKTQIGLGRERTWREPSIAVAVL